MTDTTPRQRTRFAALGDSITEGWCDPVVSVLVGGNDLSALRPDPDRLAAELETGIARLAGTGATVLLATAYDPGFSPYLRIHPSTQGHLALLAAAASALGLPAPVDSGEVGAATRLPTALWFRRHALPWIARRVRQVSCGDGRGPKLPVPAPVGQRRWPDALGG